ncbi:MAG TPA: tail fiber domain-containing protein [Hanamia sp.]
MKKVFYLLILLSGFATSSFSQNVGINEDGSAPNPNAMLDIKASDKGLLIPRTSTTTRMTIPNTKGLLVYDTTTNSFWYNNGSVWNNLAGSGNGSGWSLTGNTGTDTSVNFIGTTDKNSLLIKVNNQISGFIDANPNIGNTGWGFNTFLSNTTGKSNTAIGTTALVSNTTGSFNTATGYQALFNNTTGKLNTGIGFQALSSNTTGDGNTAAGYSSLVSNTTGNNNTADGTYSLYSNVDGVLNTAVGNSALYSNTSGYQNSALGNNALYANTTGGYNVAVGLSALQNNTTGFSNTATGQHSMFLNTTGGNNTATGFGSLASNTTGSYNIANGNQAGIDNTTGSNNIFIGASAGTGFKTGLGNICIGGLATVSDGNSNSIVIGNSVSTPNSNAIVLGDITQNVGIGTSTPNTTSQLTVNGGSKAYSIYAENNNTSGGICVNAISSGVTSTGINIGVSGYASGSTNSVITPGNIFDHATNYGIYGSTDITEGGYAGGFNGDIVVYGTVYSTSDAKLKKNIKQLDNALTRLQQLPVKEYDFNQDVARQTTMNLPQPHQFGFIAQDVQKIFPNLVTGVVAPKIDYSAGANQPKNEGTTSFLAVNYISFIPLLTKAVQELNATNESLQKQIADLTARIEALERK